MKIQLGHARDSDFQNELYVPIKESSFFSEHAWIFPHDGIAKYDSKETLRTVDVFIAEVSHPATGLGIEIGFASMYGKKILCISKKGSQISSSLKYVTNDFLEYENSEDMVEKIGNYISQINIPSQKKMYIGCALTHASGEFRRQISDFKDSLRERFEILDFVGITDGGTISPQEIYVHDRSCVLDSDIFVAECSHPSTGLGYEIATAVEHNKKILLIAHNDTHVTRMILGIPHEKATFLRYQDLDQVRKYIFQNY